jgi:hypothetical protein
LFQRFTFRGARAITVNVEYLIQTKPGKELLTAVSTMHDMKMTVAEFL